ncbi:hypothetical protein ILUMI_21743 [Ignelater luminosus]|uniref:Transposable element P transposase n=1 Tax=Ignelater luminosus TaxID=2038154 RepID=A0A8K0CDZ9_IGNLU|nr:hypothetical protein ILUMI_21743 [Ignelater luminosus]
MKNEPAIPNSVSEFYYKDSKFDRKARVQKFSKLNVPQSRIYRVMDYVDHPSKKLNKQKPGRKNQENTRRGLENTTPTEIQVIKKNNNDILLHHFQMVLLEQIALRQEFYDEMLHATTNRLSEREKSRARPALDYREAEAALPRCAWPENPLHVVTCDSVHSRDGDPGLLHNWKIPLGYFVSSGSVNSIALQHIIETVINKLKDISFKPLVLVCDQGSNNRRVLKQLGASKENPVININGQEVYTSFDAPHLLKCLRNNFMNTKVQFFINKKAVSWTDVEATYEVDKRSMTTRAMLKITPAHMSPSNFQKMRVKYAAQIFSHTVSAAIKTVSITKEVNSVTALDTADFIENINDIFDALNSRVLHDPNPKRRPLSTTILQNGIQYFQNIEVFEGNTKRNNIYCLDGFQWTLKSILLLWDHLRKLGVKYLLTGFSNQDSLENFFSVIRNRGVYNPTPTVRQCRISIQQNMNIRLQMAEGTGNCEIDEIEILEIDTQETNSSDQEVCVTSEGNDYSVSTESSASDCQLNISEETKQNASESVVTMETSFSIYVAGYLAHEIQKKFNCELCASYLIKDSNDLVEKNELFMLYKDYSCENDIKFLKRPSDQFVQIVLSLLKLFNEAFNKYKCSSKVTETTEHYLKAYLERSTDWFELKGSASCIHHEEYLLKLFIKIKLFTQLKWESNQLSVTVRESINKPRKPHRKVRILS